MKNHASRTVKLEAYLGEKTVYQKTLDLGRFPYTTNIQIPPDVPTVDRLSIKILTSVGAGGGLDEIRIRKR